MTTYVIRRLLYTIPIVFGVLLLTFVLFTLVGGDISIEIAGENAMPETIEEIRQEYGLNKPLFLSWDSQFINHFKSALTFDFGRARDRELVIDKIKRGVGPSLALTVPMFFGVIIISAQYVALPVLIGIVTGLGSNLRFYRTVMLDEMRSDYVRTAFAKGLGPARVLFKHVLKNAMIPIITRVVLAIPFLFLGSLLLERFFGIPGLGYLMIEAIGSRDYFVINAMTYISAILFVIFNVITDICYALVDPRVSFE